jgi:hypothetical protein
MSASRCAVSASGNVTPPSFSRRGRSTRTKPRNQPSGSFSTSALQSAGKRRPSLASSTGQSMSALPPGDASARRPHFYFHPSAAASARHIKIAKHRGLLTFELSVTHPKGVYILDGQL